MYTICTFDDWELFAFHNSKPASPGVPAGAELRILLLAIPCFFASCLELNLHVRPFTRKITATHPNRPSFQAKGRKIIRELFPNWKAEKTKDPTFGFGEESLASKFITLISVNKTLYDRWHEALEPYWALFSRIFFVRRTRLSLCQK